MAVLIPAVLLALTGSVHVGWGLPMAVAWLPTLAGVAITAIGLVLGTSTVHLFATVGNGTLAPWDPPTKLVVRGPYLHVRNPMISGVIFVLVGEAVFFGSLPLLVWSAVFVIGQGTYIPLHEEPELSKRFGADYDRYRRSVPRWIPRLRPWEQGPPQEWRSRSAVP